jgi:hypothetical protein
MSDDYLEAQRLHAEAERMRDEAFEYRAEADRKLVAANRAFGDAEHRHRLIADLEKSVAGRELRLLNELGEAQLIKREKIANEKLKQAEELMASYDNEKHAAAIYLRQCSEREKAERSEAA